MSNRPFVVDDPSTVDHVRPRPARRDRRWSRLLAAVAIGAVLGALLVVSPVVPVRAGSPRSCAGAAATHEVRRGDTWFGIAGAAGVPMRSLLDANTAGPDDVIHPGDVLCLPAGASLAAAAGGADGTSGGAGGRCGTGPGTYAVVSGDSWYAIAQRTATSVRSLLHANGAGIDTVLHPGEELCLPEGASRPAESTAPVALEALPVQGPCWYGDTWRAPRGNGRTHEGVDLIAESGNYVYAVANGVLTRRAWDQPGSRSGNAWWLTRSDGTYFFYAHLSDFAPGLKPGSRVRAGEIIGFVGSTGNSATAHLHFEVHPGGGAAVNPYPSVRSAGGCRTGAGYRQPNGWVPD